MSRRISKNISCFINYMQDPLFKNSFFIILTSITSAAFGFIFWILAAKLCSANDVGIATALISSMTLLVILTRFGFDLSIIRFMPTYDKSNVFNTSVIITTLFAIILGIVFIFGVDVFLPNTDILKNPLNAILFLIFLSANSIIIMTGISFIAIRKARYYLLQNIIVGSRILFLIPLISLGAIGIFSAFGISFVLALLVAVILLAQSGVKIKFFIDYEFLNKTSKFGAGNYIANMFMTAPNQLLPILILNTLGTEETAYYYIAFAISSLLFMIPISISTSLFVEGSNGEALRCSVIKSIKIMYLILIPATVLLYFSGGWLLEIIGKNYSENGLELLRIMPIASYFMGITSIYFSIKRIQKDLKWVIIFSALIFAMLTVFSYIFMIKFGLIGLGYAWILSYAIASAAMGMMIKKEGWV